DSRGYDRLVQPFSIADDLPQALDGVLRHHSVVAVIVAKRLLLAPFLDPPNPVAIGIALALLRSRWFGRFFIQDLNQILKRQANVADNGEVGRLVLVDLRRIDIDVHDLAVLGEFAHLAGHAIVEADA